MLVGRRRLLLFPVALILVPSPASGAVPTTQTCKPAKLPFTFALPADWACQAPQPYGNVLKGAKAGGMAPGFTVQLSIFSARTRGNVPIGDYAAHLAAAIQSQYAGSPGLRVTRATTMVGSSIPAVLVTARFTGYTVQGAGTVLHVDYFFIQGGYLYELEYDGTVDWVTKDISEITASARSIHFVTRA
jgi:hypothetical protein